MISHIIQKISICTMKFGNLNRGIKYSFFLNSLIFLLETKTNHLKVHEDSSQRKQFPFMSKMRIQKLHVCIHYTQCVFKITYTKFFLLTFVGFNIDIMTIFSGFHRTVFALDFISHSRLHGKVGRWFQNIMSLLIDPTSMVSKSKSLAIKS